MKALTLNQVKTALNNSANAVNESNLQDLFINAVYHGLVHGNILPAQLKLVRDSNLVGKFKAALAKHMPAKWDKKAERYVYDANKAERLLSTLGLERTHSTLEQGADALPAIFEGEKAKREYNRAEYLVTISKKLTKEGEPEVDSIIGIMAALLESPELCADAMKAIVKASKAQVKAA